MSEAEALLEYRERIERINVLTQQLEKYVKEIKLDLKESPQGFQLKNFKALHEILIRDVKRLDKLKYEF